MNLKQEALFEMGRVLKGEVKQNYKNWILTAARKGESHIKVQVDSKDMPLIIDWLKQEGLDVTTEGQGLNNCNLYVLQLSWT